MPIHKCSHQGLHSTVYEPEVSPTNNREIITDAFVSVPTKQNEGRQLHKVRALWDTGASNSVVTPHVISLLGISADGVAKTRHAGGESTVRTYLIDIGLPNRILLPHIRVSECAEADNRFDIIIGMDIISLGDFSITGQGMRRMVSFCLPSTSFIDYVQMLKQMDATNKEHID